MFDGHSMLQIALTTGEGRPCIELGDRRDDVWTSARARRVSATMVEDAKEAGAGTDVHAVLLPT